MFKRSMLRILAAVAALVAGVVSSVQVALASQVSDGGGGDAHPRAKYPIIPPPLPAQRPIVPAPNAAAAGVAAGMDWQLVTAAALLVLAVALFIAATLQRRHAAHA